MQVRLQTRAPDGPKGMFGTFVHILKKDSVLGLYSGVCLSHPSYLPSFLSATNPQAPTLTKIENLTQLSASLLRQLTYSTTRFGIYSELKETFSTARSSPSLPSLIAMASTSGFLGGIAGNPADVLNVRMQHDAALPVEKRRNYKNAVDGLFRMTREEGWRSLWRGVWPNSMRAVLMTASQLASYDAFKRTLLSQTSLEDNLTTHFTASLLAGFVATTVCSPIDVIKTRVMSAKDAESLLGLLSRTVKHEGIGWVFRGWVPSFVRLGPHTIATFLFLEQHKTIYRHWKGLEG